MKITKSFMNLLSCALATIRCSDLVSTCIAKRQNILNKKIAKLYLTHDIMLYDDEVKNNPGFVALAEHGFKITHNYRVRAHETSCNSVELTPGKLKEFFEDVYDKIDEVASSPLYEEYKKCVIDALTERAINNHNGTVTVDVPATCCL